MRPTLHGPRVAALTALAAFFAMGVPSGATAQPLTGVYRGEGYSQPNTVNAESRAASTGTTRPSR